MKKMFFYILAGGVMLSSCGKKGCTDSNAANYNADAKKDDGSCIAKVVPPEVDSEKPKVSITAPVAGQEVKQGAKLSVAASFTDNKALAGYLYTSSAPDIAGGTTISGTSANASFDVTIPATLSPGSYTISFTATDATGNISEKVSTSFSVILSDDVDKPVVNSVKITKSADPALKKLKTGSTPVNEVEFDISDNRGIDSIFISIKNTRTGDIVYPYDDNTGALPPRVVIPGASERLNFKQALSIKLSAFAISGEDPAEWIIRVVDGAKNETNFTQATIVTDL
ncbi:MAG: hypothetical protein KDC83_00615 [Flavobacteriales bacterium]|nr:hypothetical protein [Flavobacteriales bacterium]